MSNIYDVIRADHENHRTMLRRMADESTTVGERGEIWETFYYDVKSHAAAEEETFYSELMAEPKGQDDARHSVAEHKELDDLMEEINEIEAGDNNWMKRFEKLKHDYEHHMEEEENEIFDQAKALFDKDDAQKFAGKFEKRKAAERKLVDEKADQSLEA